jgi:hypothetical protein
MAALWAAALLSGCGSGSSGPADTPELRAAFAEVYCATWVNCCAEAQVPLEPERCRAQVAARTGFNPAAAQACMAELASGVPRPPLWCQTFENTTDPRKHWSTESFSPVASVCGQVFGWPGTKHIGEDCANDQECAPSPLGRVACRGEVLTEERALCQLIVRGREGEGPCWPARDKQSFAMRVPSRLFSCDYDDGLWCETDSNTCKKVRPDGAYCYGLGGPCHANSYCDETEKECLPRLPIGQNCCRENCRESCEAGAYCDHGTRTCAPLTPTGADCTRAHCANGNCVNGVCTPTKFDVPTRCARP